jgi:hypothetical protein
MRRADNKNQPAKGERQRTKKEAPSEDGKETTTDPQSDNKKKQTKPKAAQTGSIGRRDYHLEKPTKTKRARREEAEEAKEEEEEKEEAKMPRDRGIEAEDGDPKVLQRHNEEDGYSEEEDDAYELQEDEDSERDGGHVQVKQESIVPTQSNKRKRKKSKKKLERERTLPVIVQWYSPHNTNVMPYFYLKAPILGLQLATPRRNLCNYCKGQKRFVVG